MENELTNGNKILHLLKEKNNFNGNGGSLGMTVDRELRVQDIQKAHKGRRVVEGVSSTQDR